MPLQLAIVGRPNVGKSTLLNTLLQEERVLVGPEAGLTRDSIRAHFEFQGRTIYLVNIIFPQCPLFNYMMLLLHFLFFNLVFLVLFVIYPLFFYYELLPLSKLRADGGFFIIHGNGLCPIHKLFVWSAD